MSWVQTWSGQKIFVLEPKAEAIKPRDIAHALSRICRFGGHVPQFYSVAEHCIIMSRVCEPEIALHCLLHDAAEAYLGDLIMPVKAEFEGIDVMEENLLITIYEALGLAWPSAAVWDRVKYWDLRMLATEKAKMLLPLDDWPVLKGVEPSEEAAALMRQSSGFSWLAWLYRERLAELSAEVRHQGPFKQTIKEI